MRIKAIGCMVNFADNAIAALRNRGDWKSKAQATDMSLDALLKERYPA